MPKTPAPAPDPKAIITAKDGLLWRTGKPIELPEADEIAKARGFACAEAMVRALTPAISIEQLVDAAWDAKRDIAEATARLKEAEAALIARGKGDYSGHDPARVVTVVAGYEGKPGKLTYALEVEPIKDEEPLAQEVRQRALEERARELAGPAFLSVFDRHVTFTPIKEGFVPLVNELLTPARARDLIALCARTGKPTSGSSGYVKYPKGAFA